MADLDDRGQIILIAAFALAVTFVSLALVVNSAIFTENLASRGETSGSDDALVVRHEVADSVGESIEYANTYNISSRDKQEANVTESTTTISDAITNQQAETGKIVVIDGPTSFKDGTRIRDNDSAGGSDFQNATYNGSERTDWRVAESVERTRAFRMNLSDASGFVLNLSETGGSDNWTVAVTNSSGEFNITVNESGTTVGSCSTTDSPEYVHIDVTRGLLGGEPCPHMQFGRGLDGTYDILYNNSDDVTGNYSMVIDGSSVSSNLNSTTGAGDNPYETDAIYSANVTYRYDGPAITYNTSVRVAPGEPR